LNECEAIQKCTCSQQTKLEAMAEDFWSTPKGITQSINMLSQDFNFMTVNGALKMSAPTNGVKYLYWRIAEDDKVCLKCLEKATGGNGGYYKVGWFLPKIPVHPRCRCQLELVMDEP
jgi:hypothetical protein